MRFWLFAAGVIGLLGIAAHAYEVHGLGALAGVSDIRMRSFSAAAEMLTVHGLALLGLAALAERIPRAALFAGGCFLGGALLFAGPLVLYALTDTRALIHLAPVGGGLLMLGWLILAVASAIGVVAKKKPSDPA